MAHPHPELLLYRPNSASCTLPHFNHWCPTNGIVDRMIVAKEDLGSRTQKLKAFSTKIQSNLKSYLNITIVFLWFNFQFPLWNSERGGWRGGDYSHQANCFLSLLSFVRDFLLSSSRLRLGSVQNCQVKLVGPVRIGYCDTTPWLKFSSGTAPCAWLKPVVWAVTDRGRGPRGDTDEMFCKLSPHYH